MKRFLKKIISLLLRAEARMVLKRYHPKIIGITGSVGKTSAKEAIFAALKNNSNVRRSPKSFNSEIGIPLTILGLENAWGSVWGWARNLLEGLGTVIFKTDYPQWLILEIGLDRPGDIKKVLRWLRCDVAVLTNLPPVPVHLEFFPSAEELWSEKILLARSITQDGAVVFNFDDEPSRRASEKFAGRLLSYGFNEGSAVRAFHPNRIYYRTAEGDKAPGGLSFKIGYAGSNIPFRCHGILGEHQIYQVLAAVAVGLAQDMNLLELAEALENWQPPPGRMRPLGGIKRTFIIDDSYNSSPVAAAAALNTLEQIETSGRKIAVLGDMLELGPKTIDAHRELGERAAAVCDILLTAGVRARFIAEEANAIKNKKSQPAKLTEVHSFLDPKETGQFLQNILAPGDIVLIKGSQAMRLEKVVEEIMAEPERKAELLCRQEPEWQTRA